MGVKRALAEANHARPRLREDSPLLKALPDFHPAECFCDLSGIATLKTALREEVAGSFEADDFVEIVSEASAEARLSPALLKCLTLERRELSSDFKLRQFLRLGQRRGLDQKDHDNNDESSVHLYLLGLVCAHTYSCISKPT